MAYDTVLAERIRKALVGQKFITEKEAFGGIVFMVKRNVACGVIGGELMVRVGPAAYEKALKEPHVRPHDFTGRPSKGWVMVDAHGVVSDSNLKRWVKRGLAFASTLPKK